MFGLPTCVVSVVCYSLCCMEPIDDAAIDSEDEEDEYDPIPDKEPPKGMNLYSFQCTDREADGRVVRGYINKLKLRMDC